MRSLRSRVCLRLAYALAALASVPPVWVFWLRKGSPCSYNHAAIHTYPFPLPFNPSPIKPPSRFPLGACGPCGRLGQSGCGRPCGLAVRPRAHYGPPLLVLSPTGLLNDICSRLIIWLRGARKVRAAASSGLGRVAARRVVVVGAVLRPAPTTTTLSLRSGVRPPTLALRGTHTRPPLSCATLPSSFLSACPLR